MPGSGSGAGVHTLLVILPLCELRVNPVGSVATCSIAKVKV